MSTVENTLWRTGERGAGRDSCPGRRPRSCGDRASVLVTPMGVVVSSVEGTILHA